MPRNTADFSAAAQMAKDLRAERVSRAQQANIRGPKKTEYRTEVDRTSQGTADKDTPMLTKTDYQAKHGWVSPFPQGSQEHGYAVSAEEQTQNMQRLNK